MSDAPEHSSIEREERRLYAFRYIPDRAKKPPKEWPFACILALGEGEKVVNDQWCCLHAFICKDGAFEFGEGMFGTGKEEAELYGPVWWPEIAAALAVIPQSYRAAFATKPKSGEMPFERIERWHRHGYSHPEIDPDAEGRVIKALRCTELWDGWMEARKQHNQSGKENWTFAACLKDLYEPADLAALGPLAESHGNRIKQFCHEIGLKPDRKANYQARMSDLKAELAKIRDRYQITYENQQVK